MKHKFIVKLTGNPFNCVCSLQWILDAEVNLKTDYVFSSVLQIYASFYCRLFRNVIFLSLLNKCWYKNFHWTLKKGYHKESLIDQKTVFTIPDSCIFWWSWPYNMQTVVRWTNGNINRKSKTVSVCANTSDTDICFDLYVLLSSIS